VYSVYSVSIILSNPCKCNLSIRYQNNGRNFIHRVETVEPERIPKILTHCGPKGIRSIRYPQLRWQDQLCLVREWSRSKGQNVDINS
jgi:signal recognition particle subunit SEC65